MASFDPTFSAAKFSSGPNGWNCIPYGMSAGVFYFACYSLGGDSPAWVIAFAPGDGNPAHAGQVGRAADGGRGQHVQYTQRSGGQHAEPLTRGRSLHAVGETGETGWVEVQANVYESINTSNIASIPAAAASCTISGLPVITTNAF